VIRWATLKDRDRIGHDHRAVDEHHHPAFTRRLSGIEGLRGVAAVSVVLFHVWTHELNAGGSGLGWVGRYVVANLAHGVTLFFALSGFLLYLPFAAAAIREKPRPLFSSYLRNRALRILPAYWVILLLVALVLRAARIHENGGQGGVGPITDPLLLLKDLLLVQNYSSSTMSTGISPAWSLAVEVVYYITLPLLVLAGLVLARRASSRRGRAYALAAPALGLGVFGLVGAAVGAKLGGPVDVSFLVYAHLFTLGMVLAVLRIQHQDDRLRLPAHWRIYAMVAAPAVAIVGVGLGEGTIPERGETMFVSVACALLLALVALAPHDRPSRLVRLLETRPFAATGVVSYSIYLWHLPVILFLLDHDLLPVGSVGAYATSLLIVAALVGALSALTYRYVEKPALRLKARRRETERQQNSPSRSRDDGTHRPATIREH
jgi:peptidoglycan/LPS O-acetylase OafA/YrhL